MEFRDFKRRIESKFNELAASEKTLFVTSFRGDALWETYLSSYSPEDNPIYQERRSYDCNCCKSFIRRYGSIVAIINNRLVSIWDVSIDSDVYQKVAERMSAAVKSGYVSDVFLSDTGALGTDFNFSTTEEKRWEHFYATAPSKFLSHKDELPTVLSNYRSAHDTYARALKEIKPHAIDEVLDLISQDNLYRGDQYRDLLKRFQKEQEIFLNLPQEEKDNFTWVLDILGSDENHAMALYKIRNTAIGTLLCDLSTNIPIAQAVAMFESKVAPENYKRPKAVVSSKMVQEAQEKIKELGFEESLNRRFAVAEDISAANVLFINRDIKDKVKNVFDAIPTTKPSVNPKNFDSVVEMSLDKFISDVLPRTEALEILVENRHRSNFMSLTTAVSPTAPSMFSWNNPVAWVYNGELADASLITQRVKSAGGKVDAVLRVSLGWYNPDDLDLHVREPGGSIIYFGNKQSSSSGYLDIDMHALTHRHPEMTPVENIRWTDPDRMKSGVYKVQVDNFQKRHNGDYGFEIEVVCGDQSYAFKRVEPIGDRQMVDVCTFEWSKEKGITNCSLPEHASQSKIWGITTNNFHPVSMVVKSPNQWSDVKIGNPHLFFILKDCINSDEPRGIFNEFLTDKLTPHRKVLEILGSLLKVSKSQDQLSGIGFSSSAKREPLTVKVTGAITRVIKII